MVKRSQVIVEALTGVKKVDLWVRSDPGALLISLVMPYGRAQDHDVLKEPPVGAFEQIQDENCFSTSSLSAYRRRIVKANLAVPRTITSSLPRLGNRTSSCWFWSILLGLLVMTTDCRTPLTQGLTEGAVRVEFASEFA